MDCNGWQRVACALEEIATNTATNGPGLLDWLAVVIPALAAVASVVTSVVALKIARRANDLAAQSRKRDDDTAHRAERERLGGRARTRALGLYSISGGLAWPAAFELAVLGFELREEFKTSEELFAAEMYAEFDVITKWFPAKGTPDAAEIGSAVQESVLASLRDWVRNPQAWRDNEASRVAAAKIAANAYRAKFGASLLP